MLQLERRSHDREFDFNALFLLPSPEAPIGGSDETALFTQQDVHVLISTKVEDKTLEHPQANTNRPAERGGSHQNSLAGEVFLTPSSELAECNGS